MNQPVVEEAITDAAADGEASLLDPLVAWLRRTRRINTGTQIAFELSWFGRRVDLATLTRSRRTSAYELKLNRFGRALEQAAYNRLAFDRSYIVTSSVPRPPNVALAAEHGVGIIVIHRGHVEHVLESPVSRVARELRPRLLAQLRSAASVDGV